jgi:phosphorylcholine metabolism protein LicD
MKRTQREKVIERFKEDGCISNFWALDNFILRLASIISKLRSEGWDIETKYKGKIGEKNCYYYLNKTPTKTIQHPHYINNETVRMVSKEVPML